MEQTGDLGPKWYAVYVRSRHEFQALDRLTMKGIEAFLPSVERLRRWKDRKKIITFPLFPGYLFVHISKSPQERLNVVKIKGVVRLLSSTPNEPDSIPDEQINSLKKLIENKEALNPYPYMEKGQRVRVKGGPLRSIEGILVEKLDKHMLVLSVDILRQGVALTIDASDVETV